MGLFWVLFLPWKGRARVAAILRDLKGANDKPIRSPRCDGSLPKPIYMGVSINGGTSNGWFIMEKPIKNDDSGVPVMEIPVTFMGYVHTWLRRRLGHKVAAIYRVEHDRISVIFAG